MYIPLKTALLAQANPEKAITSARFFKTGSGEYGAGDIFIGVPVPNIRLLCRQFVKQIQLDDIGLLLADPIHELRMAGVLMLVYQYTQAKQTQQKTIYDFYLAHARQLNNWDFVDSSAQQIIGHYLFDKQRDILYQLAQSDSLWEQRIAIIATFYFIKQQQFSDTLQIAEGFLHHPHDLIHKATGWMLREVGKQQQSILATFLTQYAAIMPRTMLRYAIEKFPEPLRQQYLTQKSLRRITH